MRQFSHHRKSAACSSRVSFAYNERRHDSDPQFPRSRNAWEHGFQIGAHEEKKKRESRSAQARSTNERGF